MHKNNQQHQSVRRNPYQVWETTGITLLLLSLLGAMCLAGGGDMNPAGAFATLAIGIPIVVIVAVLGFVLYGWAEPLRKRYDDDHRQSTCQRSERLSYRSVREAQTDMRHHLDAALCPPRCVRR